MSDFKFNILGMGAWGEGFTDWQSLRLLLEGNVSEQEAFKAPTTELIPANERRRAPLPVKLAIESSWQATQMAELDPKEIPCVFVSGLGDTQLTDYMCKVLAGENKALSPTKFHNSVHNAAAGYWTISTGCMQSANSVAGYENSVALALMEALVQAQALNSPMLVTFYDAPCSDVLKPLFKNEKAFALSLVISPDDESGDAVFQSCANETQATWPILDFIEPLQHIYAHNPVGKILSFAKIMCKQENGQLSMPLSADTSFNISKMVGEL